MVFTRDTVCVQMLGSHFHFGSQQNLEGKCPFFIFSPPEKFRLPGDFVVRKLYFCLDYSNNYLLFGFTKIQNSLLSKYCSSFLPVLSFTESQRR